MEAPPGPKGGAHRDATTEAPSGREAGRGGRARSGETWRDVARCGEMWRGRASARTAASVRQFSASIAERTDLPAGFGGGGGGAGSARAATAKETEDTTCGLVGVGAGCAPMRL